MKGLGIINNAQDFDIVKMFHHDIKYFEIFGLPESELCPKVTENGIDLKQLNEWETRMQEAVNQQTVPLSGILRNLNCSPNVLGGVIQKYKDGNGF
ncbi:MAG TPA: hypothetical protein VH500_02985 [Nitrososphaeraceae archaeon]|jgi:hypothetical protein